MKLRITHTTEYRYESPVQIQPHLLYLRPRENPLLRVDNFSFEIDPAARIDWMRDDFDNLPASAQFSQNSDSLNIVSRCIAETSDSTPFDFLLRDYARSYPFEYEPLHRYNLGIYLNPPEPGVLKQIDRWLSKHFATGLTDTVSWLFALNESVNRSIVYIRRDEPGIQPSLTTIKLGTGTCRDYAVLLIDCARSLGLAARFVSGYLFDPANNGTIPGDMHAWVEIFLPGTGWRGLDPSRGMFCDNAYVPVAHAVVAESVNPVQGSYYSASPVASTMSSDVRVQLAN